MLTHLVKTYINHSDGRLSYLNPNTCRTSVGVNRHVNGPEFGPQ